MEGNKILGFLGKVKATMVPRQLIPLVGSFNSSFFVGAESTIYRCHQGLPRDVVFLTCYFDDQVSALKGDEVFYLMPSPELVHNRGYHKHLRKVIMYYHPDGYSEGYVFCGHMSLLELILRDIAEGALVRWEDALQTGELGEAEKHIRLAMSCQPKNNLTRFMLWATIKFRNGNSFSAKYLEKTLREMLVRKK